MSRAYRVTVKESLTATLQGEDQVSTRLELLEILPPEQTADLLRDSLKRRGFAESENGTLTRRDGPIAVVVDPCDGTVTVKAEVTETVTLQGQREQTVFDDMPLGTDLKARLKAHIRNELGKQAETEAGRVQTAATDALERHLGELQPELGRVINEVTREALKRKAAQLGAITELHEDAETGSLTIKVEL